MNKVLRIVSALFVLVVVLVSLAGCSYMNQSTNTEMKRILLRGDLHSHTKYSWDGKFTIEEVANYSKQSGYDFIALTDHNTTTQNQDPYKDNELIILPGMELTRPIGHANIIGIPDPKKDFTLILPKAFIKYFDEVKKQGAMVQLNHPFSPGYPWKIKFDDLGFDTVELWNGGWTDEEAQSMQWWQGQLQAGKKVVVTAGSDSHTNGAGRFPFNNVYSVSRDAKGILDAIKSGHLYLSISPKGPDIEIKSGSAIMGDTVPYKKEQLINITVSNLNSGDEIYIVTDKGIEFKEGASDSTFAKDLTMAKRMFYRVEVHREDKVVSLSNPLYISEQ